MVTIDQADNMQRIIAKGARCQVYLTNDSGEHCILGDFLTAAGMYVAPGRAVLRPPGPQLLLDTYGLEAVHISELMGINDSTPDLPIRRLRLASYVDTLVSPPLDSPPRPVVR